MAMNPMQRRTRNSFLVGFLVALIIAALAIVLLLYRMKTINDAKEALEALQRSVYVASEDIESGQKVTIDSLKMDTVQTKVNIDEMITQDDFEFLDENGDIVTKLNSDGTEMKKELVMKIKVPAGTIITKDMLSEVEDETTNDQRIQEYNMILLPSQLKQGDYVDIRIAFPKGEDYIVLAKKQVLKTTETGIWLKLGEDELLTLGNAIVEAYVATGAKLYAIEYTEPGLQEKATPTYPVSAEVVSLMESNPNILNTAKTELFNRYNDAYADQRTNHINPNLSVESEQAASSVEAGIQDENTKVQAARADYVSSLEGAVTTSE